MAHERRGPKQCKVLKHDAPAKVESTPTKPAFEAGAPAIKV
jgi:hypothetical protein